MERLKFASVWLGGCSGCHMSFLDLDEFLLELAGLADVVYSPIIDAKEFPRGVDLTLVEGAVANDEHLEMIRRIRERSRLVVSFGDCAVTGNVTALRNPLRKALPVLQRAYLEGVEGPQIPAEPGILPQLLDEVRPLHTLIDVDVFLPGCPPPAPRIRKVLEQLAAGRPAELVGRELAFG